jgi:hypothetical protein
MLQISVPAIRKLDALKHEQTQMTRSFARVILSNCFKALSYYCRRLSTYRFTVSPLISFKLSKKNKIVGHGISYFLFEYNLRMIDKFL